jgi:hypothetical protein
MRTMIGTRGILSFAAALFTVTVTSNLQSQQTGDPGCRHYMGESYCNRDPHCFWKDRFCYDRRQEAEYEAELERQRRAREAAEEEQRRRAAAAVQQRLEEERVEAERQRRERERQAELEAERQRLERQAREARETLELQRIDRENAKGATRKHVAENVCGPVIRNVFAAESKPELKDAERSLLGSCEKCFAEGVKKEFSRDEQSELDLVLGGRSSSLDPGAIGRTQEKYDRLFVSCSEKLGQQIAEVLNRKQ